MRKRAPAVLDTGLFYHLTGHLSLGLIQLEQGRRERSPPGGETIRLEDPVDESGSAAKLTLGLVWNF